jgi:hypothetical protein
MHFLQWRCITGKHICMFIFGMLHQNYFFSDKTELWYTLQQWPVHLKKLSRYGVSNAFKKYAILLYYVFIKGLPLWSRGQSSWLQIQRSGFDSRRYQIFWKVLGLKRGPLSLMSTIEQLLERKSSSSGLEIREYGHRDNSRWPRGTLYPQKSALTSPTSGGRSVGIVCSQTQAMEFSF